MYSLFWTIIHIVYSVCYIVTWYILFLREKRSGNKLQVCSSWYGKKTLQDEQGATVPKKMCIYCAQIKWGSFGLLTLLIRKFCGKKLTTFNSSCNLYWYRPFTCLFLLVVHPNVVRPRATYLQLCVNVRVQWSFALRKLQWHLIYTISKVESTVIYLVVDFLHMSRWR